MTAGARIAKDLNETRETLFVQCSAVFKTFRTKNDVHAAGTDDPKCPALHVRGRDLESARGIEFFLRLVYLCQRRIACSASG